MQIDRRRTPRVPPRAGTPVVLVVSSVAWSTMLIGCSGSRESSSDQRRDATTTISSTSAAAATKQTDGVVRTDLEPLTKRWPSLNIESARWMSGTLGDDRAPGPASYWIDAVLVVSPQEMKRLHDDFDLEPVDAPTDIEPQLQDLVPADPVGSPALNASLGTEARGQVYVYPDSNLLVVRARFGN